MSRYKAFPILEPFDRTKSFKVRRSVRLSGTVYTDGMPLDKNLVTTRTLRQLYEQRFIVPVDDVESDEKPEFLKMPTEKIKTWLTEHGVVLRPRWKRDKVIQMAEARWLKEHLDDVTA